MRTLGESTPQWVVVEASFRCYNEYPRWVSFTKNGCLFQLTILQAQGLLFTFDDGFLEGRVPTCVGHHCQVRKCICVFLAVSLLI